MGVQLTQRGAAIAGTAGGFLVLGKVFGIPELTALAIAALFLMFGSLLLLLRYRPENASRSAPIRIPFRESHIAECSLSDHAQVNLHITEQVQAPHRSPEIASAVGVHLRYQIPTTHRGASILGPLHTTAIDPFGLLRRELSALPSTRCVILPQCDDLDRASVLRFHHGAIRHSGGTDSSTVREYQPGDQLRRIHWRATARSDELMVRDERSDDAHHARIAIDLRPDPAFEALISGCYSFCSAWLTIGSLQIIDQAGTELLSCTGPLARETLGDMFALLEPRASEPRETHADVIFTSIPEWSPARKTILFGNSSHSDHYLLDARSGFAAAWNDQVLTRNAVR